MSPVLQELGRACHHDSGWWPCPVPRVIADRDSEVSLLLTVYQDSLELKRNGAVI
jgi:hypothetical protein